MTQDEILTGWLVFSRLNFSNDIAPAIPSCMRVALVERGWITLEKSDRVDDDGDSFWDVHLTDEGKRVADLNGPEWGVTPAFAEST